MYQGFIEGFNVSYVSATQIKVSGGYCHFPAWPPDPETTKAHYRVGDTTLTPTLTPSAVHYVYAYPEAPYLAFEVSTTAPVAPYAGTARTKSADTTRRLLGSFLTNASSQVRPFVRYGDGASLVHRHLETGATVRALLNGTATTLTAVDLSAWVPPTARVALLRIANATPDRNCFITNPDVGTEFFGMNWAADVIAEIPISAARTIQYRLNNTPASGGVTIDVYGYREER